MRPAPLALTALLLAACGGQPSGAQPVAGQPLETRPPNAEGQTPAFPGQTRAPLVSANVSFKVETVATGLDHPWAMAWLPDGRMLVTERPGRLRIVAEDGTLSAPLAGLPQVDARGQGGLLDVALSPTFAEDRLIYWSYAEPREGGNGTACAGTTVRNGPPGPDRNPGHRACWLAPVRGRVRSGEDGQRWCGDLRRDHAHHARQGGLGLVGGVEAHHGVSAHRFRSSGCGSGKRIGTRGSRSEDQAGR